MNSATAATAMRSVRRPSFMSPGQTFGAAGAPRRARSAGSARTAPGRPSPASRRGGRGDRDPLGHVVHAIAIVIARPSCTESSALANTARPSGKLWMPTPSAVSVPVRMGRARDVDSSSAPKRCGTAASTANSRRTPAKKERLAGTKPTAAAARGTARRTRRAASRRPRPERRCHEAAARATDQEGDQPADPGRRAGQQCQAKRQQLGAQVACPGPDAQRQSRISGMSSPCSQMYCRCSMSLSRNSCFA